MSDSEKSEDENSKTKQTSEQSQFFGKVERKPESQPIVINFYAGGSGQRTDRLIQTERFSTLNLPEREPEEDRAEETVEEKKRSVDKKEASTTISEHNLGKRENKYTHIIIKKLARSMSEEKKDDRSMEARKQSSDHKSSKAPGKQVSDLERKKMQAELKAAEEIAKIRQNLIEKRLALELAIIDDSVDSPHKVPTPRPSHQAELRALEEIAMRKQSLIETNLAQELESLDYQTRIAQPPRPMPMIPPPQPPPPLPPPPPPPQRQPSPPPSKVNPFRTDSASSVLNSLRGLGVPKLNLDRKFSGDSGQRTPNPLGYVVTCVNERRYQPEPRRDERYQNYAPRPDFAYNYVPRTEYSKARSTWKSAVAKIKKKMKSKQTPNWDDV